VQSVADKTLNASVHVDRDVRATLAAFRALPKQASEAVRGGSLKLAKTLARKVKAAGFADSEQAAAVAPTVKAVSDRIPAITAGGDTRVASTRVPAYALLFGSEFGARRRFGWYAARKYARSRGRQYRRHLGKGSYWFFRTVEDNTADINKAWRQVADDIVNTWSRHA